MKKIYNAPVAVIYNALPVSQLMQASNLTIQDNNAQTEEDNYTSPGGGGGNNDSRDNGNIWEEQW